jgi:hypothetical protein
MDVWISALIVWLALLCAVVGVRMGWSDASRARRIAFRPTEAITAHQLFGLLLGANLALLEHDDFNQLASALPHRRIRELLAQHWNIRSAQDFQAVIEQRLRTVGAVSSEEAEAIDAWHTGAPVDTAAYRSLQDVLVFLSAHAGIVKPGEIRDQHCHLVAWDVQQVAYLLRLGFTMGYISRDSVRRVLERLQKTARVHYTSWKDYSLSALVGMGLRGVLDLDDIGDWYQIARSHTVLLAARRSLLGRAGDWSVSMPSTEAGPVSGFLTIDLPITAFDTFR